MYTTSAAQHPITASKASKLDWSISNGAGESRRLGDTLQVQQKRQEPPQISYCPISRLRGSAADDCWCVRCQPASCCCGGGRWRQDCHKNTVRLERAMLGCKQVWIPNLSISRKFIASRGRRQAVNTGKRLLSRAGAAPVWYSTAPGRPLAVTWVIWASKFHEHSQHLFRVEVLQECYGHERVCGRPRRQPCGAGQLSTRPVQDLRPAPLHSRECRLSAHQYMKQCAERASRRRRWVGAPRQATQSRAW